MKPNVPIINDSSVIARRHRTVTASVASRSANSIGWESKPLYTNDGKLNGSVARVRREMPMSWPTNEYISNASGDVCFGFGRYLSVLVEM